MSTIEWVDFAKVDIRVGKIVEAQPNPKAKIPAYILKIDFGEEIGFKISSAQLTQNYTPEELLEHKIIAVINFNPKKIAGVNSEVLVLASVCPLKGTLLITPHPNAMLGSKIA